MKNIYVIFMIIGFAGILLVVTNAPVEGAPAKGAEERCGPSTENFCHGTIKWLAPQSNIMDVVDDATGITFESTADNLNLYPYTERFHLGQKVNFSVGPSCTPFTALFSVEPIGGYSDD